MRLSWTLGLVLVLAGAAGAQQADSLFEKPVRLTAEGQPINTNPKLLYPSPVFTDIDGDSQPELVLGDLRGYLYVHENVGKKGDLAWGKAEQLKTADGKVLKLPNW